MKNLISPRALMLLMVPLTLLFTACSKTEPAPKAEVSQPAKIVTVENPQELMIRSFPGEVKASDTAELAFRVSGELTEFPANRGVKVDQGDLLARLDPADFRAAVNQAQAEYDLAKSQFERSSELIDRKLISQAEYDQLLAVMQVQKSNLVRAQNNLDYTQLYAPFDGVVAKRLAENYETVVASQVILILQTDKMIDVSVNVPESIIARVERTQVNQAPKPVQVRFGSATDRTYLAWYKEHETDADAATLTYRVTFSLPKPEDLNVLPGMSATVIADLSDLYQAEAVGVTLIPIEAVFSAENQPIDSDTRSVWVVDPESMRTTLRAVKVGQLSSEKIAVIEGLTVGEQIIAAGVSGVHEGMLVRPLERERGL